MCFCLVFVLVFFCLFSPFPFLFLKSSLKFLPVFQLRQKFPPGQNIYPWLNIISPGLYEWTQSIESINESFVPGLSWRRGRKRRRTRRAVGTTGTTAASFPTGTQIDTQPSSKCRICVPGIFILHSQQINSFPSDISTNIPTLRLLDAAVTGQTDVNIWGCQGLRERVNKTLLKR